MNGLLKLLCWNININSISPTNYVSVICSDTVYLSLAYVLSMYILVSIVSRCYGHKVRIPIS